MEEIDTDYNKIKEYNSHQDTEIINKIHFNTNSDYGSNFDKDKDRDTGLIKNSFKNISSSRTNSDYSIGKLFSNPIESYNIYDKNNRSTAPTSIIDIEEKEKTRHDKLKTEPDSENPKLKVLYSVVKSVITPRNNRDFSDSFSRMNTNFSMSLKHETPTSTKKHTDSNPETNIIYNLESNMGKLVKEESRSNKFISKEEIYFEKYVSSKFNSFKDGLKIFRNNMIVINFLIIFMAAISFANIYYYEERNLAIIDSALFLTSFVSLYGLITCKSPYLIVHLMLTIPLILFSIVIFIYDCIEFPKFSKILTWIPFAAYLYFDYFLYYFVNMMFKKSSFIKCSYKRLEQKNAYTSMNQSARHETDG